jgi:F-type H+-transporting ATPase subunit epsilon
MELVVCSPLGVVLKTKIKKVTFETLNGYHTLLPRHVDFVSALTPSIVRYTDEENSDKFVACHQGIVVKKGSNVTISVQNAVMGNTLDELQQTILVDFKKNEENRKELNLAMVRLETGLMRGFSKLNGERGNDGL